MRWLVFLALAGSVASASAATRAERCAKYAEELAQIEEAKKKTHNEVRLHKLESKRQKILAGKAKHKC